MAFLDKIRGLLGRENQIEKISVEELKHEKIRVEQMEKRLSREVQDLESQKQKLFLKGKDEASNRQRLMLARKIKQLDSRGRVKGQQLGLFSKHLGIIDGLLQVKENMALLQQFKLGSVVSKMPLAELTAYVEKASVEGQFEMEKFTTLLGALEGSMEMSEEEEGEDVKAIMVAMEEAHAAEEAGSAEDVDAAMAKVDEILDRGGETAGPDEEDLLT